jgi:hypothetical protein
MGSGLAFCEAQQSWKQAYYLENESCQQTLNQTAGVNKILSCYCDLLVLISQTIAKHHKRIMPHRYVQRVVYLI